MICQFSSKFYHFPMQLILRNCLVILLVFAFSSLVFAQADSAEEAEKPPAEEVELKAKTATEEKPEETKPKIEIPTPPTPWVLQPYRVQVFVSFETDPLLSAATQKQTIKKLQQHLQAQFHQMWELDVFPAASENWYTADQLTSLSSDALPASLFESESDKVFFATLHQEAGNYFVQTREWDASSRTLGSLHKSVVASRREIVAHLGKAISEAFRPITELEVVHEDGKIEFLIRAGEYPPRNPGMQQFREGDFLVPYLRYVDRKREVQKIQPLPWTYMQVQSVERSRVALSITSAFGNPVAAKRRRVEIHAMRIRPYLPQTEIFIYPRGEKQNPLVGCRCEVMDRVPTEEDKVEDRLKLETDRRGIVTVPVVEKSPLQYLYVYSGQALLAKVPFIPGYSPLLEVEVPDDRPRLNVEGEVSLLQGELIDIIATREVLMARTRGAAKAKRWDDVGSFLSQLQDLPTLDNYTSRIASLEVQAVQAAKLKRDRVAEIRVKKLCSGIQEAAGKHLDPFRIAEFRREMAELKQNSQ